MVKMVKYVCEAVRRENQNNSNRPESNIKLSSSVDLINSSDTFHENSSYCSKCNTKYSIFHFIDNSQKVNTLEKNIELIEVEFSKIIWRSNKSVMVVCKNIKAEKSSFMILESQTTDASIMFEELIDKIENYYHMETKKRLDTTFSSKLVLLSNKLYNKFSIIKNFFHIENNSLFLSNFNFNLK